jgi:hypothetical protein
VLGDARNIASELVGVGEPRSARRLQDHADAMFSDLVLLGESVLVSADQLARFVPGYRTAARQVRRAESAVLRDVSRRIEEVVATSDHDDRADPRAQLLDELLRSSLETNPRRSLERLHLRILRELLPDEARILAALSDGTRFALIHVFVGSGSGARSVVTDASTVGRVAAVHVRDAVPLYVRHLRELGLAEEGPHEDELSDQYSLLLSEDYVQRATSDADAGIRGIRTVRRTLRISPLGAQLWEACAGPRNAGAPVDGQQYRSAYGGAPPKAPGKPRKAH